MANKLLLLLLKLYIYILGWPLFMNFQIFNFSPSQFFHYHTKIMCVKFGND
jgi:hypothetical protein